MKKKLIFFTGKGAKCKKCCQEQIDLSGFVANELSAFDGQEKAAEGVARSGFLPGKRRTVTLPFESCSESDAPCCRNLPASSAREILTACHQGNDVP